MLNVGLPKREAALAAGKSINEAGCAALIAMLAQTIDTNMIHRGSFPIQQAVSKELSALLRKVKDPRVQDVMISITRVETTPDLRYTKVYVSFLQEEKAADAMKGLKSAAGFLRRQLGSNLKLRYAPEIVWALDDSITYGARMLALINSLDKGSDNEEA